ncbi:sodium:solute symporter family protein [Paenibacillus sp. YK5]|uniref:Sodium/panthothenate symporter n=5 Tax=Paenibacillus TaxID=44249 RepID=A0A0U2WB44_9BACL|nr:sodium/panthothenate symporter [Paenibacillus naphthalenovorans]
MGLAFILIFLLLMIMINRGNQGINDYSDYTTGSRSFGPFAIGLSVFSSWYVGSVFTAWAEFNVGFGFIGIYTAIYGTISIFIMYLVSEKTYIWGKKYNLITQAELMGFRYQSGMLRIMMSFLGVLFTGPWLLLEWVTQGYIFSYATGGQISPFWGMLIGVLTVMIYVSMGGMRSVIRANAVQGLFMFAAGTGLSLWLIYKFFGGIRSGMEMLARDYPDVLTYPGPGWSPPTPYWTSIIIVSGLGAFMWPWIYNKMFAAKNVRAIKQSAVIASMLGFIFWTSMVFLGIMIHSMEYPRNHPEEAYMWIASMAGPIPLALMSVLIMATSISTVSGIIQAMATAISNDIAKQIDIQISNEKALKVTRISVIIICLLSLAMAAVDFGKLVFIAILTYQGIIMFFPVVFLGLYWKRANKEGAIACMIIGTATSVYLIIFNPYFIDELGWTAGMYGIILAFGIMIIAGYLKPISPHVEQLWSDIETARRNARRSKS